MKNFVQNTEDFNYNLSRDSFGSDTKINTDADCMRDFKIFFVILIGIIIVLGVLFVLYC